jgi:hypothetical protein
MLKESSHKWLTQIARDVRNLSDAHPIYSSARA